MDAAGIGLSVVQSLLATLGCSDLQDLCSIANYKSQLAKLEGTVNVVKALLQDAEQKQVLSNQEQIYIENLTDTIEEADNLFDEFVYRRYQQAHSSKSIPKIIKSFIMLRGVDKAGLSSVFSTYGLAYKMSTQANKIREKLDKIAYNKQFNFQHNPVPPYCKFNRETSSSYHEEIIGREKDLWDVMGMLLDSDVERDVSLLSIVGIGGLGKTALAQMVYNHPSVQSAFPLRKWVCVSDDDKVLDVKDILCRILGWDKERSTLEQVQTEITTQFGGSNKYLLVLDDVWTESREQWGKLVGYLKGGRLRGSWILVTTRSRKTAKLLDHGKLHKLLSLSPENSWLLFKKKAFGLLEESNNPSVEDLVKIGQVIVKRCAYVPLAIRVVGSLLRGQEKSQWELFQEFGLSNCIADEDNDIMPILKLSYYQLSSPIKSCFRYCALFVKDQRIFKEKLIQLWIAQGYVMPTGQRSREQVAEDYVSILIDRCFFQDIQFDSKEIIESFKIHDLMHDLAEQVGKNEIANVSSTNWQENNKIRHISYLNSHIFSQRHVSINNETIQGRVRSILRVGHGPGNSSMDNACVDGLKNLRTLDISDLCISRLPNSIGKLLHLRYLDLSRNLQISVLPETIATLHNLLFLNLSHCLSLTRLPKGMSELVNLSFLKNDGCSMLSYMPRGFGKLTSLYRLDTFVMGSMWRDSMEDLKGLVNLKGNLVISFPAYSIMDSIMFEKDDGREGGYLVNKEHLDDVTFLFKNNEMITGRGSEHFEAVMDELKPHGNVKDLKLWDYPGRRMPRWVWEDNFIFFFPNLVIVELRNCYELSTLGWLGYLHHLQVLKLEGLRNLEYVINETGEAGGSSSNTTTAAIVGFPFFPSLKELYLESLEMLKGLVDDTHETPCLPRLESLRIQSCPSLIANLQRPQLKFLRHVTILELPKLVNLPNWIQYSETIKSLEIKECTKLESLPDWLSKLTSLTRLAIRGTTASLKERCQEPNGQDWPHIAHIPKVDIRSVDNQVHG